MCGAGLIKGGTKGIWGCLYRDCCGAFVGVNLQPVNLKRINKETTPGPHPLQTWCWAGKAETELQAEWEQAALNPTLQS